MKIITTGRTDLEDFFRKGDIRYSKKLPHTPFVVFVETKGTVTVQIVDKPDELLAFPDKTKVMSQWKGEWRSDFFQYTVGDLRKFITTNPPSSGQVI